MRNEYMRECMCYVLYTYLFLISSGFHIPDDFHSNEHKIN